MSTLGVLGWKRALICLAWIGLVVLGAGSCAFSRGDLGVPLTEKEVAGIKKGQTTEAEVVALLGAPNSVQKIKDQTVFHYYRYTMKHGTVLVFSRANIASDDVYVFFNQDAVVEQVLYSDRTSKLRFQFWPFGG